MAQVIDDLIQAEVHDDGEGLMTMLRGADVQNSLIDEAELPGTSALTRSVDLLAGPFAHVVVDEAQELTDAEWRERLERIGLDQITVASLRINYRTPEEVMAEAEPVIRTVLPDANVPTSIRSTGVPVMRGSVSDLGAILDAWLVAHADGIACVIGDSTFLPTPRVRSLAPELSKGLEFDLVILADPETFGTGIEGAVDRYVAMTRATQQLVILTP
jgi:DNA helicase IV